MKNGFALITCLAIVIVIVVGTAGIFQAMGSHANMRANTLQEVQAKYLVEAGVEQAIWQCKQVGECLDASYNIDGRTVAVDVESYDSGALFSIRAAVDYTNQ